MADDTHTAEATRDDDASSIERSVKPYRGRFPTYDRIPPVGRSRDEVYAELQTMLDEERPRWADGFASGSVYHGDPEHIEFLNRIYAMSSQTNPLHADLWPSVVKCEAEIVAMTAHMLGGVPGVCGTLSSGGTESILLAMKAYRDRGYAAGIDAPAMVVPSTAHAAFDKAAQYLRLEKITVPVGPDGRADVAATEAAITPSTVVLIGSAPCFPNGLVDPIAELAAVAQARGLGFHTDACLGGFVLPWAERLGAPVPPFDFRVPGVTSMSADTHKYGYAAKGTSVVLYRDRDLRHFQYYKTAGWAGGLYFSPTFAGSRPGALSAVCWATLLTIGEEGYLDATRRILDTATTIKQGIAQIDGVEVIGDPLWNIAFRSDELNVWAVLDQMGKRHWSLNGLQDPPSVHLCVTLRHTQPGVAERFLTDLGDAVAHVRAHPDESGSMAPVYGMAAMGEMHGAVEDLLEAYVDLLFDA
ncbi:MAG TPA: aminotransferase class V-fold PLP-dependent enzyme [Acidimicrobiia bacterium]|nr:aminotransferase class V-fold PLP-dependent enzyme [Acidimicrobiia bacterium]